NDDGPLAGAACGGMAKRSRVGFGLSGEGRRLPCCAVDLRRHGSGLVERAAELTSALGAKSPLHSSRIQSVGRTLGGDLVGQIRQVHLFDQRSVESRHGRSPRCAPLLPTGSWISSARTWARHFLGRPTGALRGLVAVCEPRERLPPASNRRVER